MGGIIGGLLGIGSALIGSDSSSNAADAQVQAANTASQTELSMYNSTVGREQPFVAGGTLAFSELMAEMGLGPNAAPGTAPAPGYSPYSMNGRPVRGGRFAGGNVQGITDPGAVAAVPGATAPNPNFGSLTTPFTADKFHASPGYNYDLSQMMGAVQNSAASRGGLVSGNALKALQANAGGLADQDFYNAQNSYYQQQQQRFNMLQTLAGSGQNAAANLGALGSNVAGSIGANTIGAGNAASAGIVAGGQNWANLLNNQSFLSGITSMFSGGGGGGGFNPGMAMPVNLVDPSMMGAPPTDWGSLMSGLPG
jgi:hypothetical protein